MTPDYRDLESIAMVNFRLKKGNSLILTQKRFQILLAWENYLNYTF